ncbi:MAG: hypothetical protein RL242_1024 [Pseudomonadota bacterium]|mgnify:FL=1|jgi:hypothetical protein
MSDAAKVSGLSCFVTSESLILLVYSFAFSEKIHSTIMMVTTKKQGKCKFDSYFDHEQNKLFTNDFTL